MTLAFGGLLGVALIAGIVVVVLVLGSDDSSSKPKQASDAAANVKLPPQATSDMAAAAKAAGCTLSNPAYEGASHEDKQFKPSDYKTNPPTSGNHTPDWYDDGIYAPGDVPNLGKTVHPLEHGRIEVQYAPGTPEETVTQLEALLNEEQEGYHMLLFQNTTGMKAKIAATAWTHSLTCPEMNDKVFDAIRTFRARYIDKGPERVPEPRLRGPRAGPASRRAATGARVAARPGGGGPRRGRGRQRLGAERAAGRRPRHRAGDRRGDSRGAQLRRPARPGRAALLPRRRREPGGAGRAGPSRREVRGRPAPGARAAARRPGGARPGRARMGAAAARRRPRAQQRRHACVGGRGGHPAARLRGGRRMAGRVPLRARGRRPRLARDGRRLPRALRRRHRRAPPALRAGAQRVRPLLRRPQPRLARPSVPPVAAGRPLRRVVRAAHRPAARLGCQAPGRAARLPRRHARPVPGPAPAEREHARAHDAARAAPGLLSTVRE